MLAVSKTKPFELIRQAHRLGLSKFGENYAQELAEKAQPSLTWTSVGTYRPDTEQQDRADR